jgi:hypothetical protein
MSLKERTKQINEVMQETKDNWVAEQPDSPDLAIYLHFWRGEELVVMVQSPMDRDLALQAASIGAMGFSADVMSITFESYHSNLKESPLTGNDWMPKEMQYVSETYPDAAEKGWVSPCLTTTIHNRDGDFCLYSLPYSLSEDKVIWGEPFAMYNSEEDKDKGQGTGVMFEWLQDAMQRPKATDLISENLEQGNPMLKLVTEMLEEEALLFHGDVATMRTLKDKELVIAVALRATVGSKREELIRERFGDDDFITF